MRSRIWLFAPLFPLAAAITLVPAAERAPEKKPAKITWKRTVLDKAFRSEGVTVADVNRDGKMDILNGEVWYEAPTWKMHEIRPSKDYTRGKTNVYSNSFACWTEDLNGDGYPDLIVIGFPGAPCHWYENPKGKPGHWKQHMIWHSACNETPQYVDLFKNGKRVLLMGWQPKGKYNEGQMAYFTPGPDPTKPWIMHPISVPSDPDTFALKATALTALVNKDKVPPEVVTKLTPLQEKSFTSPKALLTAVGKLISPQEMKDHQGKIQRQATVSGKKVPGTFQFSHGLGVGDVNGDGRLDVVCTGGWWEQPARPDGKTPWKFHPAPLEPACADMYAYDLEGNGKAGILCSSAHGYGIWWHQQRPGKASPTFLRKELFPRLVSQTHAMVLADVNGDGVFDFVTGKRWWAHGATGDADPAGPARVYWFEARKGRDGVTSFTPHIIDEDSGIGTQFVVADVNGDKLPDVVTSNKKGTYLFEQVRGK